jgi:hypothetical protein
MAGTTEPGNPPVVPPEERGGGAAGARRTAWIVFGVLLAAAVAGDFFVKHYEHFGIDGTFGFYVWYSFAASVGLVVVAKVLGIFLRRPDDYYDPEGGPGEAGALADPAEAPQPGGSGGGDR